MGLEAERKVAESFAVRKLAAALAKFVALAAPLPGRVVMWRERETRRQL
jgi:hypothetical protein